MLSAIILSVIMLRVIMMSVIMLSVIMLSVSHYAECHYAEYHSAECHYTECRSAECGNAFKLNCPDHEWQGANVIWAGDQEADEGPDRLAGIVPVDDAPKTWKRVRTSPDLTCGQAT